MMEPQHQAVPLPIQGAPSEVPGWGWRELILVILLSIGMALGLSLVARSLIALLELEVENALVSPALYLTGLGIYVSVVAAIYLVVARRTGWATLGLIPTRWYYFVIVPPLFAVELIALLTVNLLVTLVVGSFENPQIAAISGGRVLSIRELILLLLLVAGVVPFVEELFFRGMLYPLLRRHVGALVAILLNAAIFAIFHVIPLLLPGLFVVGLFLAYIRERSSSIWPCVLLHALQNGFALLAINATLSQGV